MIPYPNIDPVAFHIWNFPVKWYGLTYTFSYIVGFFYFRYLLKKTNLQLDHTDQDRLLVFIIVGMLLGGRIGYVVIYNLAFYMAHPSYILFIWLGGMSIHGAFLGVFIALALYHYFYKKPVFVILDLLATIVPVGIFFGRIANFVNDELWGRITTVPWAIIFPNGGPWPRHPSQIYEALGEGLFLGVILFFSFNKTKSVAGRQTALALILYGVIRFGLEFFRAPDSQIGFIFTYFTMGQILCTIMVILGIALWIYGVRRT